MSVVLVHGNPETDAIWDPLRTELARDDVIALSPPGFGAPLPENFDVTSDGYLHWLALELEKLDGPIDLVGHDWGGGHVVVALRETAACKTVEAGTAMKAAMALEVEE